MVICVCSSQISLVMNSFCVHHSANGSLLLSTNDQLKIWIDSPPGWLANNSVPDETVLAFCGDV